MSFVRAFPVCQGLGLYGAKGRFCPAGRVEGVFRAPARVTLPVKKEDRFALRGDLLCPRRQRRIRVFWPPGRETAFQACKGKFRAPAQDGSLLLFAKERTCFDPIFLLLRREKRCRAAKKRNAFTAVRKDAFAWRFGNGRQLCVDESVLPPSPLPLIRCLLKCPALTCPKCL